MFRILIVDDDEVFRDGIKRILEQHLRSVTFGEAASLAEALPLLRDQGWDAVVAALPSSRGDGLELLKELKQIHPKIPSLVLSAHPGAQYARRTFKAGASGYLTKGSPRTELLRAIDTVIQGRRYVSPALAEELVGDLERGTDLAPHERLSDREYEVMRLIAAGRTVKEIATILSLSEKTISTYRTRLLEKMHMKNNAELTRYAIQNGLID